MIPVLVLAGGLGTRLRSVVGNVPKPMAEVAGHPFLWWLLRRLASQNIVDVYLSVGYMHELIREGIGESFEGMRIHYIVEEQPLGTGGAIVKAAKQMTGKDFLVLNGDTLAMLDLPQFVQNARQSDKADAALSLAKVENAGRYGTVETDENGRVVAFREKGSDKAGEINAGVYWLTQQLLDKFAPQLPARFSFEQDLLSAKLNEMHLQAYSNVSDFIDIGIPEDYSLAQTKIPRLLGSL